MIESCHECNGKVSTEAKACPHCGAPRRAASQEWQAIQEPDSKHDIPPPTRPLPPRKPIRPRLNIRARTSDGSLAPLFVLIAVPLVLAVGVVVAVQTAWLSLLGLGPLAVFGILWTVFCVAELFAVPMTARARGRDAGVWFLVTVIWLFFDTFLAVFAHVAGFVVLASIMQVSEGKANPGTIVAGILGVLVVAFLVYLPLWVLLLSSPNVDSKLRPYLRRRRTRLPY